MSGADAAGVGDGHRDPDEIFNRQFVGTGFGDEYFVCVVERPEAEGVGVLDTGHHQAATAIVLHHVHGDTEADIGVAHQQRMSAVVARERVAHCRHIAQGLDDGVRDEMGEADLAAAGALEVIVDDAALHLEQLGGYVTHAGGGGNREAQLHIGHDLGGHPPQHTGLSSNRDDGRGQRGCRGRNWRDCEGRGRRWHG